MTNSIHDTINDVANADENNPPAATLDKDSAGFSCFSFGDPESVLQNKSDFEDFEENDVFLYANDHYYEHPVSKKGLAKMRWANAHHATLGQFKANLLLKYMKPNKAVSYKTIMKLALDYVYMGECYPKRISNVFGDTLGIEHQQSLKIHRKRRKKKHANDPRFVYAKSDSFIEFEKDELIQLSQYDCAQDIYGVPVYWGALGSILLNESATNFRRKFYNNGNHMGFLFVTTSTSLSKPDRKMLEKEIKKSKGVGNFRSMYLHMPDRGKTKVEDLVKIIPVGEISTKDEFQRIKNITRDDIMSAHRVRPELAGMMPENNSGTGDLDKISRVNYENEVVPFQRVFLELNEWLDKKDRIKFIVPDFS